jgi:dolichol-phosphate mannosyltransferase
MSGFFMMKREVLEESVRDLSAVGFKLLLDILATVKRPIRIAEEPYTFGLRTSGESKLDSVVVWDFGLLLLDKLIGRYVPMRFVAFSIVGAAGVLVHLSIAGLLLHTGKITFPASQAIAATVTMIFNYSVNNVLTYRDQRKKGVAWFTGLLSFMAACSLGGLANVGLAAWLFSQGVPWFAAALAGIVVGAVWNYAMTSRYTWGKSGAHQ